MKYSGLDLSKVCESGYIMAIYKTGVEFGEWKKVKIPWGEIHKETDLLELHIFDKDSEFRAIRSVRNNGGFITSVITDEKMSKEYNEINLYTEHIDCYMLLYGEEFVKSGDNEFIVRESGAEKKFYFSARKEEFEEGIYIKVRDYYDFDENTLMYLSGYRMIGVGTRGEK